MSNDQLTQLKLKAQGRIAIVDDYLAAEQGVRPLQEVKALNGELDDFLRLASIEKKALRVVKDDKGSCDVFRERYLGLLKLLEKNYSEFWGLRKSDDDRLLTRARLEVFELLFRGESSILEQSFDAGVSSDYFHRSFRCGFGDLALVRKENFALVASLNKLSLGLWGQRGLNSVYPLSNVLLKKINQKNLIKGELKLPAQVLGNLILIAGSSVITPFIFIEAGIIGKAALVLSTATYGAYKGYDFGRRAVTSTPYFVNYESEFQYSVEKIISLEEDDWESFYLLIKDMEKATGVANQTTLLSLKPQINLALARYGSLSEARRQAALKVDEINRALHRL